jgi:hypothetical protein
MAHAPIVLVGSVDAGTWVRMDGFARPAAIADELARLAPDPRRAASSPGAR